MKNVNELAECFLRLINESFLLLHIVDVTVEDQADVTTHSRSHSETLQNIHGHWERLAGSGKPLTAHLAACRVGMF